MADRKRIIVDKNWLQGASPECVRSLAGQYLLYLPEVLFYELFTDQSSSTTWLSNLAKLEGTSFHVCVWPFHLMKTEEDTRKATDDVVDQPETERLMTALCTSPHKWRLQSMDELRHGIEEIFPSCLRGVLMQLKAGEFGDCRTIRQDATCHQRSVDLVVSEWIDSKECFARILSFVAPEDLPETLSEAMRWIYFGFYALLTHLAVRYWCDGVVAATDHTLANRHTDILYAVYLGHADGIATHDRQLRDAVRALFPDKFIIGHLL